MSQKLICPFGLVPLKPIWTDCNLMPVLKDVLYQFEIIVYTTPRPFVTYIVETCFTIRNKCGSLMRAQQAYSF